MKKKIKHIQLVLVLIPLALVLVHYFLAAIVALIFLYSIHELFFSDHIYYSPLINYEHHFSQSESFAASINADQLFLAHPLFSNIDTCILSLTLKTTFLGYFFDPYIELKANNIVSRQYFERDTKGVRTLNLSLFTEHLKTPAAAIHISGKYCNFSAPNTTALGFSNPDYEKKRILIVAPHADDAELAAFGLYKNSLQVMIVTITAGEVEATQYENIVCTKNKSIAAKLKGRLRAWDSIAIPLWAGRHIETIQLGYGCMTLEAMHNNPTQHIPSTLLREMDTRIFRNLNKQPLPSDSDGANHWQNLLNDLTAIMVNFKPDIVVTPHPYIDPQPDHLFSTLAIVKACELSASTPDFLMYANHYKFTDMYPFGPELSDLPLPPNFDNTLLAQKLYSRAINNDDQIDKICALRMMHDLNRPIKIKKRMRQLLQRIIGRSKMPYGNDDYLRKAIRQQELFWVMSYESINTLLTDKYP